MLAEGVPFGSSRVLTYNTYTTNTTNTTNTSDHMDDSHATNVHDTDVVVFICLVHSCGHSLA